MLQISSNLHTYIHAYYFCNVAMGKKIVNKFWYQFFVVVLYLMLLMLGETMAVMMMK